MTGAEHYYSILGVDANVTPEQLKQAYRDLVRIWHPDRFTHDARLQRKAEEKLKEINEAYEQLQSLLSSSQRSEKNDAGARSPGAENRAEEQQSSSNSAPFRKREAPRPYSAGTWRAFGAFVGVVFALIIILTIVTSIDRSRQPPMATNPTAEIEPPISFPRIESAPPKSSGQLASKPKTQIESQANPQARLPENRLTKAELLAQLGEDVIEELKESRRSAERLLALHEEQKQRLTAQYERSKILYDQGVITRAKLEETERALGEAMVRVEEDKRWITESEVTIREVLARDAKLRADIQNQQPSATTKERPITPAN